MLLLLMVFIAAGCALYFILQAVIDENLDEILSNRAEIVKLSLHRKVPSNNYWSPDQSVEIQQSTATSIPTLFSDTMINSIKEGDLIAARTMSLGVTEKGQTYKVTLILSRLESDDFAGVAFWFMLGIFALIILILFIFNHKLSTAVWHPFYQTLDKMSVFKIDHRDDKTIPDLYDGKRQSTGIDEFDQLNLVLNEMIRKIQTDFINLKEFTENASHETQTPLAIIKSKLETVLQDQTLSSEQHRQIKIAYEAANRLSKLNEALLLLAKIENQQFPDTAMIDLCELVKQRLELIEELMAFKNIKVTLRLDNPAIVQMNSYLAEILINNLLGNAIKHNVEGGQIIISSTLNQFSIANSGKPLTIAPEKLFQRFTKQSTGNESTGLGLAIASEICLKSGIALEYDYQNNLHTLTLNLSPLLTSNICI